MPPLHAWKTAAPLLRRARTLAREPFFHFLALGLLIFLARGLLDGTPEQYRITVGTEDVRRLATGYDWQFGRPPTATELSHLVERHIEEEILYREGVAMGLDEGDEIVRRRVVQKLQFLQEDVALVPEPGEAALRRFTRAMPNATARRRASPCGTCTSHPTPAARKRPESRAADAAGAAREALPTHRPTPAIRSPARTATSTSTWPACRGRSATRSCRRRSSSSRRTHGTARCGRAMGGTWCTSRRSRSGPASRPFAEVREARCAPTILDEQRREINAAALAAIKAKYVVVREDLER